METCGTVNDICLPNVVPEGVLSFLFEVGEGFGEFGEAEEAAEKEVAPETYDAAENQEQCSTEMRVGEGTAAEGGEEVEEDCDGEANYGCDAEGGEEIANHPQWCVTCCSTGNSECEEVGDYGSRELTPYEDGNAVEPNGGEDCDDDEGVFNYFHGEETFAETEAEKIVAVKGYEHYEDAANG